MTPLAREEYNVCTERESMPRCVGSAAESAPLSANSSPHVSEPLPPEPLYEGVRDTGRREDLVLAEGASAGGSRTEGKSETGGPGV